jgi:hypothetical protein
LLVNKLESTFYFGFKLISASQEKLFEKAILPWFDMKPIERGYNVTVLAYGYISILNATEQ